MRLQIKVKPYLNKSWLWVRPEAELDMASADAFRLAITKALAAYGCRNLWLDFSAVSFIDSSGLGVLLGRYRELQPLGGSIIITRPNEQVYHLLTAAGLHRIMEIDRPATLKYGKEGF